MAITEEVDYYGTLAEAVAYFGDRLFEEDFLGASDANKEKALFTARKCIDALKFRGYKNPVYDLYESLDDTASPTAAQLEAAEAAQELQFPRDGAASVPQDIKIAQWELAHELLKGRDPAKEIENLELTSDGAGSTRLSFDRSGPNLSHIVNGIVSFVAWRHLLPYLKNPDTFRVYRGS